MATGEDFRFLEESSRKNPNEAILNQGRVGEPISAETIRAVSSPAILEHTKEEVSYQDDRSTVPLSKQLTRSCPQQLSESSPLTSNSRSRDRDDRSQVNDVDLMDESRSAGFISLFECCIDAIIIFRNSKLILVLPIAFASLPLSTIVMGILYAGECRYLPISGALVGVMGILFIGLWIAKIICRERGAPCADSAKFLICFILLALVILVVIDMVLVSLMSPSFIRGDKNFCHKTFYDYSKRKEVWIVAAFIVSAIFYLPRSRHFLCCCSCCSTRPTLPNMRYLSIESME